MEITSIQEAGAKLSYLIEKALAGEEIILSKEGKPVVKLTPIEKKESTKKRRPGGSWKGKIQIADNFDDEDQEINEMFEGKYS